MIICMIFLLPVILMKNKVELILFLKYIEHYFSKGECTQKKCLVFLKLCLQCIKIQKTKH